MEKMLPRKESVRTNRPHWLRAAAMALLLAVALSGTAFAQTGVSGTVTSTAGEALRGVRVQVKGTDTRALTDANGKYSIRAPSDAVLSFSLLGRRAAEMGVLGRSTIDVTMDRVAYLDEVTITGYTEQRRADITGAVGSVDIESASRQTGASVLQRLDATVPGVKVEASGSPGARSTVRIRGVSSFQNNDPLYIVDGTPVQDTYVNFLNPNDITSVQVLKDASAASIYGSRASNGVIVIETTRKGVEGPPRATLRVRTGMTQPTRGYDEFLIQNSLDYFEIVRRTYVNAGQPVPTNIYGSATSPTVPNFIWPNNCGPVVAGAPTPGPCATVNPATYAFPNSLIMPGSAGTNWWKTVFGTGKVSDVNLDVAGGGDDNQYGMSFSYFNQDGTAAYNNYKRGSVRVNTAFIRNKLSFGENIAISADRAFGGIGNDGFGEGFILGKNILSQPVVPVYDINGNFASGKAVGLGNNTNPLKAAFFAKDNVNKNNRIFGNVFAGLDPHPRLAVRSRIGFNLAQGAFAGFTAMNPENSEPTFTTSINENTNQFMDWTWSNTLKYDHKLFEQHTFNVLLGQEANAATSRFLSGAMSNLVNESINSRYLQDALGGTKTVLSGGGKSALLSFFGKADYNFADKYVASVTLRKDGSSNLGPSHRWGTFPALGLGWRLSKESFMAGNSIFSDVMLRYGWGVTGNQQIPSGRIVSQFGGNSGDTFYDIGGTNSSLVAGYRQTSLGNPDLKWEENRSQNVGADLSLFSGKINLVLDVYQRNTNNLLFDPPTPGTAGVASPPIVNIGKMKNTGFDFSIGHTSATWSATFQGSRYKNEVVSIDGVQNFVLGPGNIRFGRLNINQVGHPIGSFYGLVADGMFRDAADVLAHPTQGGAAPGRIKFRDVNGDGAVTLADRTIIGSPHPDFTAGLDLGYRWKAWDLSATMFGTFGNEIFDGQKQFYIFRNFSTNVREDLLTDSWTPTNLDAKYPQLDINDNFSNQISSYYVEDGSYVRMRNLQIGYNVPPALVRWISATRVYFLAENLFTITGYNGLDPALPAQNSFGPAGDIRDQYRGVDLGTYPSNRVFSIGLVTSF